MLRELRSNKRVQGLTHAFYRYPGRFSPEFARSVIHSFSKPGDAILDPFVGGGTTAIEALVSGRRVLGIDLNPLAVFVARVKSTPLSRRELGIARRLVNRVHEYSPRLCQPKNGDVKTLFRNVPWWIRNSILMILEDIRRVRNERVDAFLRCSLLKTAQWALDCRAIIPGSAEFLKGFYTYTLDMCDQMEEYWQAHRFLGTPPQRHVSRYRRLLLGSALDLHRDRRVPPDWIPFKLVLTSPPYPGVHVLYNRWQVKSRRETLAPFAILNVPDGHFESFYTFGDRRRHEFSYFETLAAAYRSIANLIDRSSLVVQLVSFANPKRDIGRFLDAMDIAGFDEVSPEDIGLNRTYRPRRLVPNRKWYTEYRSTPVVAKEVLLFHRIRGR